MFSKEEELDFIFDNPKDAKKKDKGEEGEEEEDIQDGEGEEDIGIGTEDEDKDAQKTPDTLVFDISTGKRWKRIIINRIKFDHKLIDFKRKVRIYI